jgi:ADP-heptose:LPS heptosyltransferase
MFEDLRRSIGLTYARFHFRKRADAPMRFSDAVTRSRKALVVFPDRPVDTGIAEMILRYLTRRYANGSTTVLVREDLRNLLPPMTAARIVTYSPTEITSWFTPRSALIRRLKSSTFDAAFDLNTEFSLPSAFLCRESGAGLRVSFSKDNADDFYNLQIRTAATTPGPSYQSFMRCLDML